MEKSYAGGRKNLLELVEWCFEEEVVVVVDGGDGGGGKEKSVEVIELLEAGEAQRSISRHCCEQ